jgi:PAS domain S-box-containing protein
LDLIHEQAPFAHLVTAADGRIQRMNDACARLFPGVRVHTPFLDLLEEGPRGKGAAQTVLARGWADGVEVAVRGESVRWMSLHVWPKRWSSGIAEELHVAMIDVTKLVALRERLLEGDAPLRILGDSAPVLLWMAGPDGRCTYFNGRWLEFTGRTLPEELGDAWAEGVHPEDLQTCIDTYMSALVERRPFRMEYRLRRADDAYRWVLDTGTPRFGEGDRFEGFIGSCIDVTELREAREGLVLAGRTAERAAGRAELLSHASSILGASFDVDVTFQRLAELLVSSGTATWCALDVIEPNGVERRVAGAHAFRDRSEAVVALFERLGASHGVDGPRLLAGNVRPLDLGPGDDSQRPGSLGARWVLVVPLVHREGPLGALTLARAGEEFSDADVLLAKDLSTRASVSLDNARLYHRTLEAIGARDEFLSVASHELRTPLAALVLQLANLQRSIHDGKPDLVATRVAKAVHATTRLARLVEELLDVSRGKGGDITLHREHCDLAQIVRDVVERMGDHAKNAGCEVAVTAPLPVVGVWDHLRMEQVVVNLLSNALKYGAGKPIFVEAQMHGEDAQLTVRDGGIGIAEVDAQRIFVRFERAVPWRHYAGLGLGLYIARQIIEAHGGRISVESKPAEGALFTVRLPLALAPVSRSIGTGTGS